VSEVVLTGLSSGVKYRFRVTAISGIGCSTSQPSPWVTTPESIKSAVRLQELKVVNGGKVRAAGVAFLISAHTALMLHASRWYVMRRNLMWKKMMMLLKLKWVNRRQ
jgi:hypothetical protein